MTDPRGNDITCVGIGRSVEVKKWSYPTNGTLVKQSISPHFPMPYSCSSLYESIRFPFGIL